MFGILIGAWSRGTKLTSLQPPNPTTVLTLLSVLRDRSALRAALKGRDEATLQPVLRWLIKHISDARHIVLTTRVSMLLLELYSGQLGWSPEIDRLVEKLHDKVRLHVENAQSACSTQGMLDMILAAA